MNKKSNRAKRIMERLLLVEDVTEKAVELRKMAGLPEVGFKTAADFQEFFSRPEFDYSKLLSYEQEFKHFVDNTLKGMGIHVGYSGLHAPLHTYFILNTTSPASIAATDVTGCAVEKLRAGDTPEQRMMLPAGLYIRLGPDTTITELLEFVRSRANVIRANQDLLPRKRLRPLNSGIYDLINKYLPITNSKLQQMTSSPSPYKHILIAAAINLKDKRKISSDTVKTYIQRQKKRRRGDI